MSIDLETLQQAVKYVAVNIGRALTAFTQHDSFLYWPFLVSAALIALCVAVFVSRAPTGETRRTFKDVAQEHWGAAVWWHPSARADYRLYFANALVLPLLFSVLLFTEWHVVRWIDAWLGTAPVLRLPHVSADLATRAVFTVVFFVAYDFGRFVAHSLLHDVPVLWEFHKVHHSAEKLTPMTTFRAHPVDLLVMAWVPALATGLVTWVFNRFAEVPVTAFTYLGLHVFIVAFGLVGTLKHSHVWLSYGRLCNKWFISPAHHQLHHSYEPQHIGCNRGFELALWDRLYGTLYVPSKQERFRMGLGDGTDGQWHTLARLYLWPFWNAAKRLVGAKARAPIQTR